MRVDAEFPRCVDGSCEAHIDLLTPEIIRAFAIKSMLTSFAEMNIGNHLCSVYEVSTEDLYLMSLIMAEEQELHNEEQERLKGKDSGSS